MRLPRPRLGSTRLPRRPAPWNAIPEPEKPIPEPRLNGRLPPIARPKGLIKLAASRVAIRAIGRLSPPPRGAQVRGSAPISPPPRFLRLRLRFRTPPPRTYMPEPFLCPHLQGIVFLLHIKKDVNISRKRQRRSSKAIPLQQPPQRNVSETKV